MFHRHTCLFLRSADRVKHNYRHAYTNMQIATGQTLEIYGQKTKVAKKIKNKIKEKIIRKQMPKDL